MKPAGLHLLSLIMAGTLTAQESAPGKPAKTSPRLRQEIQGSLPKYTPPPPPVLDQPKPLEHDPDVFALPKMTVQEYRPPNRDPDRWLTERGVQEKAMAAYRQSMSDFEWALNSWHIPLLTPSASARARTAYATGKSMAEIRHLHSLISTAAPGDAAKLEKERVKMHQAEHWQNRPAGDGRKK